MTNRIKTIGEGTPVAIESNGAMVTVIRHWADDHLLQEAAAVIAPSNIDVRRAAVYVQLLAEQWFGHATTLHNRVIAAALIEFYGCSGAVVPEDAYGRNWREPGVVDLYWHREFRWEGGDDILEDTSLRRDGLKGFIRTRGSRHS